MVFFFFYILWKKSKEAYKIMRNDYLTGKHWTDRPIPFHGWGVHPFFVFLFFDDVLAYENFISHATVHCIFVSPLRPALDFVVAGAA